MKGEANRGYRLSLLMGVLLAVSLVGCSQEVEIPVDECDHLEHVPDTLMSLEQGLAQPGPWSIPGDVLARGDEQYVTNTQAGAWNGEGGCAGGITPGGRVLKQWLVESFPQISSIGGYSCRPINGNPSLASVHSTGRALDIFIPRDGGEADNDLGDPVAHFLIEHAEEIGIQFIIWDRWVWNGGRRSGSKSYAYTGAHPHDDHLHIELSLEGAVMNTPWFDGAMEPPDSEPCELLGASGGMLDDKSPCFRAYGPAQYWRRVEGQGINGRLLWTNAWENDSPSNWARWSIVPSQAGEYSLEIHTLPEYGIYSRAEYLVKHAGVEDRVFVDQSAVSGWQSLGNFRFGTEPGQHLSLYDNVSGGVIADQKIMADAIRLTRLDPDPDPDPDMGMGPDPDMGNQPDPDLGGEPDAGNQPDPDLGGEPDVPDNEPDLGKEPDDNNSGRLSDLGGFNGEDTGPGPSFSGTARSSEGCSSVPGGSPTPTGLFWTLAGLLGMVLVRRR